MGEIHDHAVPDRRRGRNGRVGISFARCMVAKISELRGQTVTCRNSYLGLQAHKRGGQLVGEICAESGSRSGHTEGNPQCPVQIRRLAGQGNLDPVPGSDHSLVHSGHLLFEPPLGVVASCLGGLLCRRSDLGSLAVGLATQVADLHRAVSGRRRVGDFYSPLSRSAMATGGRRDATGYRRR